MERSLYCKAMEGPRRADYTSLVAGSIMLARLTSAKDAKTCTRYISNSSQIPWYTKGAGWRHLCMHHKLSVVPRPHRLFHLTARPSPHIRRAINEFLDLRCCQGCRSH